MSQKKIILADDDKTIHLPLSYYLTEEGFEVLTVDDGRQAFSEIEHAAKTDRSFDLLITDIEMPELSGLELIDKLSDEGILLPILVITGFGDKQNITQLRQRGCDHYIIKPIQEKELIESVNAILGIKQ